MIRVFPRKNKATPTDEDVYFTGPPLYQLKDREVYVSCTFTSDRGRSEALAEQWKQQGYNVKLGGPAYDDRGGDFVPGRFLKPGYVITSRGCNNNCWFCSVHDREGSIRELPIMDGWLIQDNSLLQCSESHIRKVFAMLKRQPEKARFTGGFEAELLKDWHIDLLLDLKPEELFFAYDDPRKYDYLKRAGKMILDVVLTKKGHRAQCYCLIGYPKDTFELAEKRLKQILEVGFVPFAMLYKDHLERINPDWTKFQRLWASKEIIYSRNP